MQLFDFISEVDTISKSLTKENLEVFINNLAFNLTEAKRNSFINYLNNSVNNKKIDKNYLYTIFLKEYEEISKKIESIESEKRSVDSELYYDENCSYSYYDDDNEDVALIDNEDVIKDINEAISFIDTCVDYKEYEKGFVLVKRLINLKICTSGDYYDYYDGPLDLYRLKQFGLLNDFDRFKRQALFLAYFGNDLGFKVKEVYSVIYKYFSNKDFSLININQINDEKMLDFNEFLPLFLKYLLAKEKRKYEDDFDLINNTLSLIKNDDILFDTINNYYTAYPKLLKNALSGKLIVNNQKKLFNICLNCLYKMNEKGINKSEIAILLANKAITLNENKILDNLYYIAFINNVNLNNYLRLKYFSNTYNKDDIAIIINEYDKKDEFFTLVNLFENNQNIEYSLNNIYTLYLLLKNSNEKNNVYNRVVSKLISETKFNKEDFINGTNVNLDLITEELFILYFNKIKEAISFDKSKAEEMLYSLKNEVINYVNSTLENKCNYFYSDCALLLAILGEMFEGNGYENYKYKLLLSYKTNYYRFRTFTSELNNYFI